jgi:hypothetical protein
MEVICQIHATATFTSKEKIPDIHCTGGFVGFRIGVDVMEKKKNRKSLAPAENIRN